MSAEAKQPGIARRGTPPAGIQWGRLGLTLAIGGAGGAAAAWRHFPIAWMLGAMTATTVAAMLGVGIVMARPLRNTMTAILGVMLGSAFLPGLFGRMAEWSISLLFLIPYIFVMTGAMAWLLWRFARYDLPTAYFASAPGGFNEMVTIGSALGGDVRTLALSHASRVLFVVLTIPLWFSFQRGYVGGQLGNGAGWPGLVDIGALIVCAALGSFVFKKLRSPAPFLIGPMVFSASLHLSDTVHGAPPGVVIAIAQVIVGCSIGARFAGVSVRQIAGTIAISAIATAVCLGITMIFAEGLHLLTGLDTALLVLAYSPGGLTEMSLIALYLNADTAFVSTHHIVRVLLIIVLAPLAFRFLDKKSPAP